MTRDEAIRLLTSLSIDLSDLREALAEDLVGVPVRHAVRPVPVVPLGTRRVVLRNAHIYMNATGPLHGSGGTVETAPYVAVEARRGPTHADALRAIHLREADA